MGINDAISKVLGYVYPKYDLKSTLQSGMLGPFDVKESQAAQINLAEKGYHIMSLRIPEDRLQFMKERLSNLTYFRGGHSKFDSKVRDGSVNWVKNMKQVVEHVPEALELMADPTILHIVQEYLGCAPLNTQTNTWWSTAKGTYGTTQGTTKGTTQGTTQGTTKGTDLQSTHNVRGTNVQIVHSEKEHSEKEEDENEQQSQVFHQDFTWIKFIKIFVYMNDVDRKNGAHRYIPGSFTDIKRVVRHKHTQYMTWIHESGETADKTKVTYR